MPPKIVVAKATTFRNGEKQKNDFQTLTRNEISSTLDNLLKRGENLKIKLDSNLAVISEFRSKAVKESIQPGPLSPRTPLILPPKSARQPLAKEINEKKKPLLMDYRLRKEPSVPLKPQVPTINQLPRIIEGIYNLPSYMIFACMKPIGEYGIVSPRMMYYFLVAFCGLPEEESLKTVSHLMTDRCIPTSLEDLKEDFSMSTKPANKSPARIFESFLALDMMGGSDALAQLSPHEINCQTCPSPMKKVIKRRVAAGLLSTLVLQKPLPREYVSSSVFAANNNDKKRKSMLLSSLGSISFREWRRYSTHLDRLRTVGSTAEEIGEVDQTRSLVANLLTLFSPGVCDIQSAWLKSGFSEDHPVSSAELNHVCYELGVDSFDTHAALEVFFEQVKFNHWWTNRTTNTSGEPIDYDNLSLPTMEEYDAVPSSEFSFKRFLSWIRCANSLISFEIEEFFIECLRGRVSILEYIDSLNLGVNINRWETLIHSKAELQFDSFIQYFERKCYTLTSIPMTDILFVLDKLGNRTFLLKDLMTPYYRFMKRMGSLLAFLEEMDIYQRLDERINSPRGRDGRHGGKKMNQNTKLVIGRNQFIDHVCDLLYHGNEEKRSGEGKSEGKGRRLFEPVLTSLHQFFDIVQIFDTDPSTTMDHIMEFVEYFNLTYPDLFALGPLIGHNNSVPHSSLHQRETTKSYQFKGRAGNGEQQGYSDEEDEENNKTKGIKRHPLNGALGKGNRQKPREYLHDRDIEGSSSADEEYEERESKQYPIFDDKRHGGFGKKGRDSLAHEQDETPNTPPKNTEMGELEGKKSRIPIGTRNCWNPLIKNSYLEGSKGGVGNRPNIPPPFLKNKNAVEEANRPSSRQGPENGPPSSRRENLQEDEIGGSGRTRSGNEKEISGIPRKNDRRSEIPGKELQTQRPPTRESTLNATLRRQSQVAKEHEKRTESTESVSPKAQIRQTQVKMPTKSNCPLIEEPRGRYEPMGNDIAAASLGANSAIRKSPAKFGNGSSSRPAAIPLLGGVNSLSNILSQNNDNIDSTYPYIIEDLMTMRARLPRHSTPLEGGPVRQTFAPPVSSKLAADGNMKKLKSVSPLSSHARSPVHNYIASPPRQASVSQPECSVTLRDTSFSPKGTSPRQSVYKVPFESDIHPSARGSKAAIPHVKLNLEREENLSPTKKRKGDHNSVSSSVQQPTLPDQHVKRDRDGSPKRAVEADLIASKIDDVVNHLLVDVKKKIHDALNSQLLLSGETHINSLLPSSLESLGPLFSQISNSGVDAWAQSRGDEKKSERPLSPSKDRTNERKSIGTITRVPHAKEDNSEARLPGRICSTQALISSSKSIPLEEALSPHMSPSHSRAAMNHYIGSGPAFAPTGFAVGCTSLLQSLSPNNSRPVSPMSPPGRIASVSPKRDRSTRSPAPRDLPVYPFGNSKAEKIETNSPKASPYEMLVDKKLQSLLKSPNRGNILPHDSEQVSSPKSPMDRLREKYALHRGRSPTYREKKVEELSPSMIRPLTRDEKEEKKEREKMIIEEKLKVTNIVDQEGLERILKKTISASCSPIKFISHEEHSSSSSSSSSPSSPQKNKKKLRNRSLYWNLKRRHFSQPKIKIQCNQIPSKNEYNMIKKLSDFAHQSKSLDTFTIRCSSTK